MNRITALLLAMATLLIHVLVVHRGPEGSFGPPFDSAHTAYRLGRNLARETVLAWSVGPTSESTTGGLASYPSPLLVATSAVFERAQFTVTRATQILGILCVLFTVFLSTRFDTDRIAGVVPALLLVTSGAAAAAGASGTEWPLAMVLLATSFVALEHGRSQIAAIALALLALTRVEAIPTIAVLALCTKLRRRTDPTARSPDGLVVFVPAVLLLAAVHLLGASLIGDAQGLVVPDGHAVSHGLRQLFDFARTTVTPVLIAFPLVALALGELSGVGVRALAAAVTWWAAATLLGGGPPAFDLAFVPALPLAFIAIQQGMVRALDTYRRSMERLVWVALGIGLAGSLLASRFPDERGALGLRDIQESFWSTSARVSPGRDALLGRSSLYAEIRLTEDLRRIGTFLRDRLPSEATVLSPWPGALGYLTRVRVIDLFGRTAALPGGERVPWSPDPPRLDLEAALSLAPDYIVPTTGGLEALATGVLESGLPVQLFALDPQDGAAHRARIAEAMRAYEVVVTTGRGPDDQLDARPLVLLRRRGIEKTPELTETRTSAGLLVVRAGWVPAEGSRPNSSLPQVFDVVVTATRADGRQVVLDPTGRTRAEASDSSATRSLVGIVIDPRSRKPVSLARLPLERLEEEPGVVELDVRLLHHGLSQDHPAALAAEPLSLRLR